ncbi:MAG: HIT domain-containing protein [Deltaproteobacteria bacterium]|jgi:histidine triad (HIT) family protein|nr:HIT domain-containing protein [Deltaproteobacteria bacterium]
MSKNCLFCKIVRGEIPSQQVLETENIFVFEDINPIAPVHFLLITKKHISSLNELEEKDSKLIGEIIMAASKIGNTNDKLDKNYRLICSTGEKAGQVINHVHFHLIGGRELQWPPG